MNIHRAKRSTVPTTRVATLGAAVLMAFTVSAEAAPGESGITTIERMATSSNLGERVFIRVATAPLSMTACSYHSDWHFVLDTSTEWGKKAYAMVLEARATGRKVWLSGTDNVCWGDVQLVRSVTTYD